jgi:hypothetical protein
VEASRLLCARCGGRVRAYSGCTDREADFRLTDATRILSAACYLDPQFRITVHNEYLDKRHQAIGPNYGVDLPTVVRHCLHARQKALLRSIAVTVTILLLPLLAMWGAITPQSAALFAVIAVFGISFAHEWLTFDLIRKYFSKHTFDPVRLGSDPGPKRDYLRENGNGNVTVYRGFIPFVGAGTPLNSWSFTVDLRKGKSGDGDAGEPREFQVAELYQTIQEVFEALHIENLETHDRLYVSGRDVRDDERFLKHRLARPFSSVDAGLIGELISDTSLRVRHYRCVRVVDWSGELVASMFFRFSIVGHSLFVESSHRLLTPIDERYRRVERIHCEITVLQVLIRLGRGILWGIMNPFWAPLHVIYRTLRPIARAIANWVEDWLLSENPGFDYGAERSLREIACEQYLYRRYGQRADAEMHLKLLDQTLLNKVIEFLDEHNVDTSDLKERGNTILNSGVILSGGVLQAESIAVGQGARSLVQRMRRKQGQKKAAAAGTAA